MTEEANKQNRALNKTSNKVLIWALLSTLLSAVAVSVSGVIYTGISNDRNNRQWCELLAPLNTAYKSEPPQTELGKQVAKAIAKLYNSFEC